MKHPFFGTVIILGGAFGACGAAPGKTLWQERTERGGTVRLETDRGQWFVDESRKKALREMKDWCRGPVSITWEGHVSAGDRLIYSEVIESDDNSTSRHGSVEAQPDQFWEIRFDCHLAQAPRSRVAKAPGSFDQSGVIMRVRPAAQLVEPAPEVVATLDLHGHAGAIEIDQATQIQVARGKLVENVGWAKIETGAEASIWFTDTPNRRAKRIVVFLAGTTGFPEPTE